MIESVREVKMLQTNHVGSLHPANQNYERFNVLIIGAGVVGKATGIGLDRFGHNVVFSDIKTEVCEWVRSIGHQVVKDLTEAVSDSQVSFICVQTPTKEGQCDFSYLEKAATDLGKSLSSSNGYHVVVVRSTVLPSITRRKIIPILEERSGLKAGKDFGVCVNPEFLREATPLNDFLYSSRIVIGQFDEQSGDVLESLYRQFEVPIFRTDLEIAEIIKYATNSFLATKISFFNELYLICKQLYLDPEIVAETVALDPRIGDYGIRGGRPFGGSCLPKDLKAFISFLHDRKMNPAMLTTTQRINEKMKHLVNSAE